MLLLLFAKFLGGVCRHRRRPVESDAVLLLLPLGRATFAMNL